MSIETTTTHANLIVSPAATDRQARRAVKSLKQRLATAALAMSIGTGAGLVFAQPASAMSYRVDSGWSRTTYTFDFNRSETRRIADYGALAAILVGGATRKVEVATAAAAAAWYANHVLGNGRCLRITVIDPVVGPTFAVPSARNC